MKLSVWHEQSELTGRYSVRWYDPVSGLKQRRQCDTFKDMQKTKAEIMLELLNYKKGNRLEAAPPLGIFDRYLAEISTTHRPSTLELKRFALKDYLGSLVTMANITEDSINEWQRNMVVKKYKKDTMSLRLRELRAFINWCIKKDIIGSNPFKNISIPSSSFVGRRLNDLELQALLDKCPEEFKPMLVLEMETGARKGELLSMTWDDIDVPSKVWTIPAAKCKTKRARAIPLSDTAMQALASLFTGSNRLDQVFLGWQKSTLQSLWKRAKRDAGIEGRLRFHDLRHTFASSWQGRGDSLKAICGWTTNKMLEHYKHVELNEVREDMESSRKKFGVELGQNLRPEAFAAFYKAVEN